MTRLTSHSLPADAKPAKREHSNLRATMDDSAMSVMTDFTHTRAICIRGEDSLQAAETLMISAGVRLLFALNDEGVIIGLLSYRDIVGQRATAAAVREDVGHHELSVSSVMTALGEIETLDLSAVQKANVREVVEHMHHSGRQHALVTESQKNGDVSVRGMFSIVRIGRQLGINIEAGERAQSFSEIEQLLAHG